MSNPDPANDPSAQSPYQSPQTVSPAQHSDRLGDDLGMRVLLPVGRSGFAIAAGYLGLFSVLFFPAPLAVVFGLLAIWHIQSRKHSPKPVYGMGRAIFGLVMGLLFTGLLVATLLFVA